MWLVIIYIAYGSSQLPVREQYCMYSDQENPTLYGAQPSTKIINNNVQSTFLWYKQRYVLLNILKQNLQVFEWKVYVKKFT